MTTTAQTKPAFFAALTPGTARVITHLDGSATAAWVNSGSWLKSEPMSFHTETEARDFCRDRGLRVV